MTSDQETTFSDEDMDAIRDRVRQIMAADGLNQADVARASGIKYGTFTGWLGGSYQGRNDKIASDVQIWLDSREDQKRVRAVVPEKPEFLPTQTATAILDTLRFAHIIPDIAVVAGGAGLGKTYAVSEYARVNPNVWIATMQPSTSGVYPMLIEIAESMGVTERVLVKLSRAIGRRAQGAGGLIVIDDAQHLSSQALDQLRSLHDLYGVGVGLVGNETVYARLEGEGRKAQFAQLFSRIGVRLTQARPRSSDVGALIEAWGVSDAAEVRFLKAVAAKPGALRGVTKVMQLASMLAAGAAEPRDIGHIKAAWNRLSSNGGTIHG